MKSFREFLQNYSKNCTTYSNNCSNITQDGVKTKYLVYLKKCIDYLKEDNE